MKSIFSAIVVLSGFAVFGATYRTNNVEGLVYLLKTYSGGGHTVELEAGDYWLQDDMTWATNSNAYASHLYVANTHLKGVGDSRDSVRLIGCGTMRVMLVDSSSTVANLTITNGYAANHDGYNESNRGGGVYGGALVTNCVIIGNTAEGFGGGGGAYARFVSCLIKNNVALGSGGGFHRCYATDCQIVGNRARNSGGGGYTMFSLIDCDVIGNETENGPGAGGCEINYATNCLFAENRSMATSNHGGAISNNADSRSNSIICHSVISNNYAAYTSAGAYGVTMTNCVITHNHSAKSCGGAMSCDLFDCDITFNSANSGNGGGASSSILSNCTVFANICSNLSYNGSSVAHSWGGGLYECTAYDSEIYGNYARSYVDANGKTHIGTAGGAANSTLYDCEIHDNYADSYGGGVRASTLVRCTVADNCGGSDGWNAYACTMTDCDVSGTTIYSCSANGTRFHDIGKAVTLEGNPYVEITQTPTLIAKGYLHMTNCLFACNGADDGNNITFFQYASAEKKQSTFVNCTIVSNIYENIFTLAKSEYPVTLENCVLFGNRKKNGTWADISLAGLSSSSACPEGSLIFRNCAYGTYSASGGVDIYMQEPVYVFGANGFPSDPKFMGARDSNNPFSLRRTSPLIGKGAYAAWMEGVYDVRGEGYPRANGENVDLGCYQCWLNPVGTVFSIR